MVSVTTETHYLEPGDTVWVHQEDIGPLTQEGWTFSLEEYDGSFCRVELGARGDGDFEPIVCGDCGRTFGPDEYDTVQQARGARAGHGQAHSAEQAHQDDEEDRQGLDELFPEEEEDGV